MITLALLFTVFLLAAHLLGHVPLVLVIGYGVMSALTFLLYGLDKHAAKSRLRRIPETTLHLCALLGGWPGALLAQPLFNHKRRKGSFQLGFWTVSVVNGGMLAGWLMR